MVRTKTYSDREIDAKNQVVIDRMEIWFKGTDEKLNRIEAQTTKTNGRVNQLEDKVEKNDTKDQVFRARIYTAVGLLAFFLGSILIPIVASLIQIGKV